MQVRFLSCVIFHLINLICFQLLLYLASSSCTSAFIILLFYNLSINLLDYDFYLFFNFSFIFHFERSKHQLWKLILQVNFLQHFQSELISTHFHSSIVHFSYKIRSNFTWAHFDFNHFNRFKFLLINFNFGTDQSIAMSTKIFLNTMEILINADLQYFY